MKRPINAPITFLLFLAGVIAYSCSQSTSTAPSSTNGEGVVLPDGTVFTRAALLDAFGACILSEITEFEAQSRAFATAANAAVADPSALEAARLEWEKTIDIWQRLEVMQVGPAGRRTQPGGLDFRDSIYAFPHQDRCEIDENLTTESYAVDANEVSSEAQGLGAAEYLLFSAAVENECAPENEINTTGGWASIDDGTLRLRRARYAAFAADGVAETAASLLEAWSPEGEDFLAELTRAGAGSRTYGRKRVALNAVSDALAYVDWGVKDNKLARPLGLRGCGQMDCADYLEAKYSRRSKEHLRNNLIGFRKLFMGCGTDGAGLGFDDYLYAIGSPALAAEIDGVSQAALDGIAAIEEADLVTALETDKPSLLAVHETLGTLGGLLLNDLLVALNLELPQMVQGDND